MEKYADMMSLRNASFLVLSLTLTEDKGVFWLLPAGDPRNLSSKSATYQIEPKRKEETLQTIGKLIYSFHVNVHASHRFFEYLHQKKTFWEFSLN